MKKFIVFIIGALLLIPLVVKSATILFPYQGGTGFSTSTTSTVGYFLQISSTSPYLTYTFASALTATPTLQQVTDAGAITLNQIQFAGGTSTAAFTIQGLLTAPTGSFTYTDATTTNATFSTVGTLTASNATITNVSSTNMSVSSSLLVTGKAVCLADGTNCLPTTTPTLQQVATAGNTTSLALQFAGGTSTAAFTVQDLLTATTASTTGNASVGGAFGLTGAATLGSTLAVTGISTLATTTITALSVSGNTTGTTAYYTGLTVAGTSDLQGAVFIGTSGATVNGGVTAVGVTSTNLFATTARFSSLSLVNPLPLTSGGTNASLTASNGGIFYSTASAGAILAGTATANKVLMSGASGAPSWSVPTYPNASATAGKIIRSDGTNYAASTATYPDTTTINQILYSSSANTIAGITTANSGVLVTSAGGVPSIATDIPTAVTIGSSYIYRVGGTDVSVADGGTGASSLTANGVLLGNGTSAVAVTATGTANQILTSNGGSTAPTFQDLPTSQRGMSALASNFTMTAANGTYEDTGLSITLPSAGTYEITADVCSYIQVSSGTDGYINTKFYNSTDSVTVPSSTRLGAYQYTATNANGFEQRPTNVQYTVNGSKTIKLYAASHNGGGYTAKLIESDLGAGSGCETVMMYKKLSN